MENKLKSRKLFFVVCWNIYLAAGFILKFMGQDVPVLDTVVMFAGTITAAYVGVQGWIDKSKLGPK